MSVFNHGIKSKWSIGKCHVPVVQLKVPEKKQAFLFLFIYLFQYCYEIITIRLYGILYIGYAYRKSMGVEMPHLTFWPWKVMVKVESQGH